MRTWIWTPLAATLMLSVALTGAAIAGGNPNAVLALHIGTQTTKDPCAVSLPAGDCSGYTTSTNLNAGFFNVYLTVADYDSLGIAGAQWGIQYDGAAGSGCDVEKWTTCADLEFSGTNWPAADTGNLVTWEPSLNCQGDMTTFAPILVGVFQVTTYSSDVFSIVPRPVDGKAKVADCNAAEDDLTGLVPSRLATASFGGTGYNPCSAITPVKATTWGSLKRMFEN